MLRNAIRNDVLNLVVHEIYLPAQDSTWWFNAGVVSQYVITARCDDGKAGGVDTAQSVISLVLNLVPEITNLPRMIKMFYLFPCASS